MKINITHQQLLQSLELISKVSVKHVTLPVLQCVVFEVSENTITAKATNLELNIEITIPGIVEAEGNIAIPTQTLLQSIQYATAREVHIEKQGDVALVVCGKSVTKINLHQVDEFPTIQKINEEGIIIDGKNFVIGIKTVSLAASQTSIKPELGSIFIQQKKEHSLTFVATDSFRLMEKTVPQKGVVLSQSVMIPVKNAVELARVADVLADNPVMMITETQCALVFESGVYISSRLVSGTFPDYQQIIPKEFSTHVTLVKQDLVVLLKKTQVFLNKFMQVNLVMTLNKLEATSQNGEIGTVTDEINVSKDGDDLSLNFNHRYLSEPLQYIHDDTLELHFAGIGRPLIIEGASDKTLRYLVMPMNR
jgi:DNA polymerase III subunit beta